MKGLELSRRYYFCYGEKMLKEQFPQCLDEVACGLFGSGSECYGFDDEISTDHDFEPGFLLLVSSDVDENTFFQLERAYSKLPREFEGYKRGMLSAVGGHRHGVFRTSEFFLEKTGSPDGELSLSQWLTIDENCLAEAINGEIFYDGKKEVSRIREKFSRMPSDVMKKRLAGNLLIMAQSGQYNYPRCLQHGQKAAAQLALNEFVKATMKVIFLLNRSYMPYYKWSFKALRNLPVLSISADILEYLLTGDFQEVGTRQAMVETLGQLVTEELIRQGLTRRKDSDLEKQAYAVNDTIEDGELRNLNILAVIF